MRGLLVGILVLAAAGCSTEQCRKGTVFISYTLINGAEASDTIDVTLAVGAGTAQTKTVTRKTHGASGSIEVDFAAYPSGQPLAFTLTALMGMHPLASALQTVTANPGCTAVSFTLDGKQGDLGGVDLAGGDASTTVDDLAVRSHDLAILDLGAPGPFPVTVQLQNLATASGSVSGTSLPAQPNIDCGATCTQTYTKGTTVTLTANPSAGYYFGGWSGDCSGVATTCTVVVNASVSATATFTPANVAFVTSTSSYTIASLTAAGSGNFVAGADSACAALAPAGTTDWVAWVSTSTLSALSRISAASGWVRTDGLPFTDSPTKLSGHLVYYPLERDETGAFASESTVYSQAGQTALTGTDAQGQLSTAGNCSDWTITDATAGATAGIWTGGAFDWTSGDQGMCNNSYRLYCFQTKYHAVVPALPRPSPSRIIFLSKGLYGIAITAGLGPATTPNTADAVCASEASQAGLSGTYLALLATTGASAASRFPAPIPSPSPLPVVRPDGVVVVDDFSTLFTTSKLRSGMSICADQTFLLIEGPFTGASDPTAVATTGSCGDWTSTSGNGVAGNSTVTQSQFWWSFTTDACTANRPIYCLQSQ